MLHRAPATKLSSQDAELAALLGKLWPHREHESNALMSFFCHFDWHRWRPLDVKELVPGKQVRFCCWCSKVRVDGVIYDG